LALIDIRKHDATIQKATNPKELVRFSEYRMELMKVRFVLCLAPSTSLWRGLLDKKGFLCSLFNNLL